MRERIGGPTAWTLKAALVVALAGCGGGGNSVAVLGVTQESPATEACDPVTKAVTVPGEAPKNLSTGLDAYASASSGAPGGWRPC